jgi:hypothetical protein
MLHAISYLRWATYPPASADQTIRTMLGYADDLDNETEFTQPAMKKLRNLAGPQPKA